MIVWEGSWGDNLDSGMVVWNDRAEFPKKKSKYCPANFPLTIFNSSFEGIPGFPFVSLQNFLNSTVAADTLANSASWKLTSSTFLPSSSSTLVPRELVRVDRQI